jgi:hypothetical protein
MVNRNYISVNIFMSWLIRSGLLCFRFLMAVKLLDLRGILRMQSLVFIFFVFFFFFVQGI